MTPALLDPAVRPGASRTIQLPAVASAPAPHTPAPAVLDPAAVRPAAVDDEWPGDAGARELLLDRAFGPARFAKTCERLRAGRRPAAGLALVARTPSLDGRFGGGAEVDRGNLIGTVRLWHVAAGRGATGPVPALMLGPLAVEEAWRGHRVGARLMEEALRRARALGHGAVLLVGDLPFYARFGFAPAPAGLHLPGPVEAERFLALELTPGALAGATGPVRATGAIDLAAWPAARRPEPVILLSHGDDGNGAAHRGRG